MVEALPIYKGKSVRARLNSLQQIMVDWDESESAVIIEKQNVIDWDRKVPPPPPSLLQVVGQWLNAYWQPFDKEKEYKANVFLFKTPTGH